MRFKQLALAMLTWAGGYLTGAPADALEVRFYPGALHTYELDQAHNASSLLVHNIAILNDGSGPVTVTRVEIELLVDGRVLDTRTLGEVELKRAAAQGSQLQAGGLLEPLSFMFGGDQLLPAGTKLPNATLLARGEGILISTQVFGYMGKRDQLRVRAIGDNTVRETTVPIISGTSKTEFILPLKGVWMDGAGSSLHSHHRWVPMEQFAHDFMRTGGADHTTHIGDGVTFADYYAYGQPVMAAASGTVTAASDTQKEDPSVMRQKGEALDAYFQRLQVDQMTRLAKGPLGILGNYVVIDHGNNEYSLYAHLKPGSVAVKVGQKVDQGGTIAAVGSAGNSTEPHLHFQVCEGADPMMCVGIPPTWKGVLPVLEDCPRAFQTGDEVYNAGAPRYLRSAGGVDP
jgi:murein DD-endopeptidase MepM/ murein hydrolase activator NlpD